MRVPTCTSLSLARGLKLLSCALLYFLAPESTPEWEINGRPYRNVRDLPHPSRRSPGKRTLAEEIEEDDVKFGGFLGRVAGTLARRRRMRRWRGISTWVGVAIEGAALFTSEGKRRRRRLWVVGVEASRVSCDCDWRFLQRVGYWASSSRTAGPQSYLSISKHFAAFFWLLPLVFHRLWKKKACRHAVL
jgi:hypothetical protein